MSTNQKTFEACYTMAKYKVKSKMWTLEYAKGYLSCYLNNVLNVSNDQYDEYASLIDDLE